MFVSQKQCIMTLDHMTCKQHPKLILFTITLVTACVINTLCILLVGDMPKIKLIMLLVGQIKLSFTLTSKFDKNTILICQWAMCQR